MEMPGVVWMYSILVAVGIIWGFIVDIGILANPYGRLGLPPLAYYASVISLILVIPQGIFIYLFFMLKRSSLTWLYISFELDVILNLISQQWIFAVVLAVFGWVVWDYISHKKVNGQPVFT